jgi:hypothetical protein
MRLYRCDNPKQSHKIDIAINFNLNLNTSLTARKLRVLSLSVFLLLHNMSVLQITFTTCMQRNSIAMMARIVFGALKIRGFLESDSAVGLRIKVTIAHDLWAVSETVERVNSSCI